MSVEKLVGSAPVLELIESLVSVTLSGMGDIAKAILLMRMLDPTHDHKEEGSIALPLLTEIERVFGEKLKATYAARMERVATGKAVEEAGGTLAPVYQISDKIN